MLIINNNKGAVGGRNKASARLTTVKTADCLTKVKS